jgi:L-amino acid N-acyltransferase YncA
MAAAHNRWTAARLSAWYSAEQRATRSREAMQGQAAWVGDVRFGRTFRDKVGSAAVEVSDPLAWANRVIELPGGHWCVTGVRFRGLDVTRPFVDVVATSLPPKADALAALSAVVVPQYTEFEPRALRVQAPAPDELVAAVCADTRFAGAAVDQYIVAGLVSELLERAKVADYDRVALRPTVPDASGQAIATMYAQLQNELPDLPQWATPSTVEELEECAAEGLLFEATVDGATAGAIAARRDDDHGMTGFVVQDIVLGGAHRGRRLAPALLQRLLGELPANVGDALWGSIHPDNQPSLRNARSVGREIVGGYVWITPQGLTGL